MSCRVGGAGEEVKGAPREPNDETEGNCSHEFRRSSAKPQKRPARAHFTKNALTDPPPLPEASF